MHSLTTAQLIRKSKAIIVLIAGLFGVLVMISNLTDYANNYEYVGHILSMDTTVGNERLMYRAVTSPIAHHRIYWMIITLESIFTTCCLLGAYQMLRNLHAPHNAFHEAKKYAIIGLTTALFVYYFCLQVIANEWFEMDTSEQWNMIPWTKVATDFLLPALIFVSIKNDH
ncbi:DUF2165 domain-containing protein [Pseudomonas sp. SWRI102]|uniref:DUF2165 domain-containing protein n=1 Tax=Pseudomonas marvdashtae TaxID=2745500 RepID=A0A923FQT6_9PSED|nr:DUF2165 domain-containing protein [Pseudomonas marvdashtae]MBV4550367.1 DUF2165 domain-containing protein [Pseudomonas marvdashtae]